MVENRIWKEDRQSSSCAELRAAGPYFLHSTKLWTKPNVISLQKHLSHIDGKRPVFFSFFFFFLHVFTSSHFHWPFSTYSLGLHTKPAEWGMCVQLGVPLSVLCETKSVKHHTQKKKKNFRNLLICNLYESFFSDLWLK